MVDAASDGCSRWIPGNPGLIASTIHIGAQVNTGKGEQNAFQ